MIPTSYGIIIMDKENKDSLRGDLPAEAFLMPDERRSCMGYCKVGYLEQLWYILKYKLGELFRRR
jgi:hypothetical protein